MKKELVLLVAWAMTIIFELVMVIVVEGVLWKMSFTILLTLSIIITYDLWEDFKNDD